MAHLVVDAQATMTLQAAEGLLDLPAPGLDRKALAADRADQFGTDAVAAQEVRRVVAGEAAIQPDQQAGGVRIEIRREGMDGIAILHVGRDHPHPERIALGVDHQHALAAIDGSTVDPVRAAEPARAGGPVGTFLLASYPRGPRCGPVFTLCVSMIAAAGRRVR